jgi:hypothetical protein
VQPPSGVIDSKTLGIEHVEDVACTAACTSSTETDLSSPSESDVGIALAMIERLPLSDEEKAEAVRRLLSTQQSRS